jgi:Fanconi anemia group M protein
MPVAHARADAAVVVVLVERRPGDARFMVAGRDLRAGTIARTMRQGAPLMEVADAGEVATWIARLARQEARGDDAPEGSIGRKPPDLDDLVEQVVAWFPGVSFIGARRLLEHFRSLDRLVAATEPEIREVHGFGPKRAAAIVQLARHCYRCTPPGAEPELAAVAAEDPAVQGSGVA